MAHRQRHEPVTLAVEERFSRDDKPACAKRYYGSKSRIQFFDGTGVNDVELASRAHLPPHGFLQFDLSNRIFRVRKHMQTRQASRPFHSKVQDVWRQATCQDGHTCHVPAWPVETSDQTCAQRVPDPCEDNR